MKESELLRRLRERDPEAVELLFEQFLPSVWRLVCTRVDGDVHLAEDLVNETMLALLRSLEKENATEIKSLGGWLHTVAIRKVQDHYRAAARVRHLLEAQRQSSAGRPADPADPISVDLKKEHRLQIREVMESLPEQYRFALEWKYIDGVRVDVIAARLETTQKGAESILFRARKAFREKAGVKDIAPRRGSTAGSDSGRLQLPISKPGLCGGQAE